MNKMSDDLISRKALLEEIDLNFIIPILKINMREEYKAVLKIREIIMNMPTAFDKEKVIEELNKAMSSAQLAQSLTGTDLVQCGTFLYGYYNGIEDAIEIVEKGGIE